jgi:ubiquinone/menaquinone biosynthesis C-methylase UbiE
MQETSTKPQAPAHTGHRRFAAFWDWAVRHESKVVHAARREVAGGARGRVLELGVGVGANWQYLPEGIDYSGIEPDAFMVERARKHAAEKGRSYDLRQAPAEALPFPDATFDTIIVTLSLCTVQDLSRSLAEARRVLKPGGELRFAEHVRANRRAGGWLQDRLTPAWRRIGAGCHLNRPTADAIRDSGFEITELRPWRQAIMPMITGVARAPGAPGTLDS